VRIEQQLPESLRNVDVDHLDALIEALRKGEKQPSERQLFGPTLLEFIARRGGIVDTGGELKAMDADRWHRGKPGMPRLIRESTDDHRQAALGPKAERKPINPDDVALAAWEEGYFPEHTERPTTDDLFEAIREELNGKPRRIEDNQRNPRAEFKAALNDLDQTLSSMGIDVRKARNEDIKAALRQAAAEPEGGYEQGEPVAAVKGDELGPAGELTREQLGALREAAREVWLKDIRGTTVEHPTLGKIYFSRSGEGEFFTYSADPDKLRLVPALKEIVRGAEHKGTTPHTPRGPGDNVKAYHWLEADVTIGGKPRRVGITVFEDRHGNKFYNLTTNVIGGDAKGKGAKVADTEGRGKAPSQEGTEPSYDQKIGPADDGVNLTFLQTRRGKINFGDGEAIITLFRDRDLSTVLHETGHLWLEELFQDAADPTAPQSVRDDAAAVLRQPSAFSPPPVRAGGPSR
jgi:hypothetical protein